MLDALAALQPRLNSYIPHKPTPTQAAFLWLDTDEAFYGGAGGGGKSDALLMAAAQYIDVPGYAAILFRRSYTDLALPGAIMSRAKEWWLGKKGIAWNEDQKTFTFPSGATITFAYLQTSRDKYRYQGAEFQYCTTAGTQVRMADHTYKPVERLEVGDWVATLDGPRPITHIAPVRMADCVEAVVYGADGAETGRQVHSADHRVLTPEGWRSYADRSGVSPLSATSSPTQYPAGRRHAGRGRQRCRWTGQRSSHPRWDRRQLARSRQLRRGRWDREGTDADPTKRGSGSARFDDSRPAGPPPQPWIVPVVRFAPAGESTGLYPRPWAGHYAAGYDRRGSSLGGYQSDYRSSLRSGGGSPRRGGGTGPGATPPRFGVGAPSDRYHSTGSAVLPPHSQPQRFEYAHPYTRERQRPAEGCEVGTLVASPVGQRPIYGITVAGTSHYITQTGLIQANCAFDELTQFDSADYTFLFSRLRKPSTGDLSKVPLRMRSASNPGGEGHDWVKERFIPDPAHPEIKKPPFIPAKLKDNPHLDINEYRKSLSKLSDLEREQIENGNWDVLPQGTMFDKANFVLVTYWPPVIMGMVRYWDKAGTAGGGAYTAGVKMARVPRGTCFGVDGQEVEYVVVDVVRGQWSIGRRNSKILTTTKLDGLEVQVWVEQEPGSGGSESALISVSELAGYDVHTDRVTGEKEARARGYAAQVEHKRVGVLSEIWTRAFMNEHHSFPDGPYKDQVDAASGAFNKLALMPAPIEMLDQATTDLITNFKGY